jgi:hypothetical protein
MYNINLHVHPRKMMANYIIYILLAPSHHLNKHQNLATNHQKKKVDKYKRLILGLAHPQDVILPHGSSLRSLKECSK